jgi:hypothetical protein
MASHLSGADAPHTSLNPRRPPFGGQSRRTQVFSLSRERWAAEGVLCRNTLSGSGPTSTPARFEFAQPFARITPG